MTLYLIFAPVVCLFVGLYVGHVETLRSMRLYFPPCDRFHEDES